MKSSRTYIAATVLILASVVFLGGSDSKTGIPDPIEVDGQTITFTHTDDNTDEDLIIWSDKATYSDSISTVTMYVAVTNTSNDDQDVELLGYFKDSKRRIDSISVLKEETTLHTTPIYETTCVENKERSTTTTQTCTDVHTGTSTEERTTLVWKSLEIKERTGVEKLREMQNLEQRFRKDPGETKTAEHKSTATLIPEGQTAYFKVFIQMLPNTPDSFVLEAVGSKGGYGILN